MRDLNGAISWKESIFYFLFLISVLVLNSVHVGPFSVRVYFTLVMFLYLVWNKNKLTLNRNYNIYVYLFLLFVFFKGIALLINGEFIEYNFVKNFLAYEFVAIVIFYATIYFTRSERGIILTLLTLSLILLTTSVVTILQYNNSPIGWMIGQFFGELSEDVEMMAISSTDEMVGFSITTGILRTAYGNAMFVSSIGTLAFGFAYVASNRCAKLLYLLCGLLGLVACFMTQQRSAFYIMLLSFFLIFYLAKDIKPLIIFLVVFIFLSSFVDLSVIFNEEMMGRLVFSDNLLKDNSRAILTQNAISFLGEHLFAGGPMEYFSLNGMPAHNFFLNAFIYGGLIGGLILVVMFFKILFLAMSRIFKTKNKVSISSVCFIALSGFLGQGLFHNESLVFSATLIFILLPLALVCANKEDTNYKEYKQ